MKVIEIRGRACNACPGHELQGKQAYCTFVAEKKAKPINEADFFNKRNPDWCILRDGTKIIISK